MNENDTALMEIDLLKLAKAVWRRIWIVLICVFICGAIGFTYAQTMVTPLYKASTMIYVNNTSLNINGKVTFSSHNSSASQSLISTYQVILNTRATMNRILEETNLDYSCDQLKGMISTASVNGTEVLKITVTSPDPSESEMIANCVAEILPDRISDVVEGSSVKVVDYAIIPSSRFYPSASHFATIGFAVGALLSVGYIVLRELLDNQVRSDKELAERFPQAPVLALIPDMDEASRSKYGYGYGKSDKQGKRQAGKRQDVADSAGKGTSVPLRLCRDSSFSVQEAYKLLRTNIVFSMPEGEGCRVLGVTSALRGDGKSTTAMNLAYVLAEIGKKVLLMEADMRLPTLKKRIRLSSASGLSNVLVGLAKESDAIEASGLQDTLDVLPAGDVPPNPSELLGSDRMKTLLDSVKARYDYVLIDLPPVNAVADGLMLSRLVQSMILVVRQGYDDFPSVTDALKRLEYLKCKVMGIVMTCVRMSDGGYGRHYSRYGRFGGYKRYGYHYGGGYHYYGSSNHYSYGKYGDRPAGNIAHNTENSNEQ